MSIPIHSLQRVLGLLFVSGLLLAGCAGSTTESPTAADECPVTQPQWATPPEDAAVDNEPAPGYYFVNEDRTIWASAWWGDASDYQLRSSQQGVKVGWFRPAGKTLNITGQRLDGEDAGFEAIVPCCYPTRFQATGLVFPTAGCWEVTAEAGGSELVFVVWVAPGEE